MTKHKTITPERYERENVKEPVADTYPRLSFYQRYSKIVSVNRGSFKVSMLLISGYDPASGPLRLFYSSGCPIPRQQARLNTRLQHGDLKNVSGSGLIFPCLRTTPTKGPAGSTLGSRWTVCPTCPRATSPVWPPSTTVRTEAAAMTTPQVSREIIIILRGKYQFHLQTHRATTNFHPTSTLPR